MTIKIESFTHLPVAPKGEDKDSIATAINIHQLKRLEFRLAPLMDAFLLDTKIDAYGLISPNADYLVAEWALGRVRGYTATDTTTSKTIGGLIGHYAPELFFDINCLKPVFLYIHPPYRKRGITRTLFQAAAHDMKKGDFFKKLFIMATEPPTYKIIMSKVK